ncbi:MAG: hypothetical protein ACKPKO_16355, partial [Candidatus Fonsibacter sp.]
GTTWGYFLGCKRLQRAVTWQVSAAVELATLATHDMLLLNRDPANRKASGLNFSKDELVVVVCAAIRHVVGPLRLVMDSVLSDGNDVLKQLGLEALHPRNVQIRFASELTGPNVVYTILVRHPQFRADVQVER